jgi:hypothetical protein
VQGAEYLLEPIAMVFDDADDARERRRFPGVEVV